MSSLFRRAPDPAQYDETARAAVVAAQEEAAALRHGAVQVEHFLLGVAAVEGPGRDALERLGVRLEDLRVSVAAARPPGQRTPRGGVPFDASTRPVLERAVEAARAEDAEVSSAHVLLGVLAVRGLAAQVAATHGVDAAAVRRALATAPPTPSAEREPEPEPEPAEAYRVLELAGSAEEWAAQLNGAAAEGWRLVAVEDGRAILRRA